ARPGPARRPRPGDSAGARGCSPGRAASHRLRCAALPACGRTRRTRRRSPRPRPPAPPPGPAGCAGSLLAQDVPDAAHGLDEPRLAVRLGLAAEIPDENLERVRVGPEVVAPDPLEDHPPRQDDAWIAGEELQQRELGAGELERALAARDL